MWVGSRAAQCIDKELLISKNGNIDIEIEIDKRVFFKLISILILIRAYFDNWKIIDIDKKLISLSISCGTTHCIKYR